MAQPIPFHSGSARAAAGSREGAVLALVLVVMVVLAFVGVGLMSLSTATGMEAGRSIGTVQAFWTAEAGLERVKTIGLKRNRPFQKIAQAGSPSGYLYGSNALVGTTGNGSYAVDVLDAPGWTNSGAGSVALKKYLIVSRATAHNGAKQRVSVTAMIQSYASYMHATHWERSASGANPLIYFGPADVIDGPVYVNDRINVHGSARFLQLVSSATNSVNYSGGGSVASFEGGLRLNAPPLDISGQFSSGHIPVIKSEAQSFGLALVGDHAFNFKADGSYTYIPVPAGTPTNTGYLSGTDEAIYVDGNAWVNGVVKGNVTLAAQNSIFISNSITYASAQSPNPWQAGFNPAAVNDTLGLVASNQVRIVGTNAVTIHAAIMVTGDGGGFNAQSYTEPIGGPYLNLFGSLSQFRRGPVGQTGPPVRGFSKNYKYDLRFLADAPPNFPYSTYFGIWEQDGY